MLKIVICNSCRKTTMEMAQRINAIIAVNDIEADVAFLSTKPQRVLDYIEKETGIYLFIIEVPSGDDGFDGIELAKKIRQKDRDSYIVFISETLDKIQRALKGHIRPSGFYQNPINSSDLGELLDYVHNDYTNFAQEHQVFRVNIGGDVYIILCEDIIYFEAYDKKIYIHTHNQRIGYYSTLSSIEKKLNGKFMRCHKSFIINTTKIKKISFSEMMVEMKNGAQLSISRTYKNSLKNAFRQ